MPFDSTLRRVIALLLDEAIIALFVEFTFVVLRTLASGFSDITSKVMPPRALYLLAIAYGVIRFPQYPH